MTFRRLLRSCLLIVVALDVQTRCALREATCHSSDPGCNLLSLFALYPSSSSSTNLVPRALYVSDLTPAGAIFQFSINQSNGELSTAGSFTTANNSNPLIVRPDLRFGYASNNGGTNIDIFTYDANTGAATPNGSATNLSGVNSQSCLVEPRGRFYYTSNQGNNTISQFAIDEASGGLTAIGAAVGSGGTTAAGICTDLNGRWLYVQNVGAGGGAVAVDLQGGVYCATNTQVAAFSMDETTGALTLTNTAPITIAGNVAQSAVFHVPR